MVVKKVKIWKDIFYYEVVCGCVFCCFLSGKNN